jgi:hypothetical protein
LHFARGPVQCARESLVAALTNLRVIVSDSNQIYAAFAVRSFGLTITGARLDQPRRFVWSLRTSPIRGAESEVEKT